MKATGSAVAGAFFDGRGLRCEGAPDNPLRDAARPDHGCER